MKMHAKLIISAMSFTGARILKELEELRESRIEMETEREEMVKRIKTLQSKSSNRRNQGRLEYYSNQ